MRPVLAIGALIAAVSTMVSAQGGVLGGDATACSTGGPAIRVHVIGQPRQDAIAIALDERHVVEPARVEEPRDATCLTHEFGGILE